MRLLWHENGWEDYLWWQTQDKKTLKRINLLIRDMQRSPFEGIGKPEPLRDWNGYWSHRINDEHRLVYKLTGENTPETGDTRELFIVQCATHYE